MRGLIGLLLAGAVLFVNAPAHTQSAITAAGMDAYNRGDIPTAYRLLRKAAEGGDPEGQVNLGYLYARGQGVPANQAAALRLYKSAAAQGDSEGMNAIGYKYQFGTGVPRDIERAIHWYCQAVALGNPRALNNLAVIVDAGRDLPRDVTEARNLWEQAAAFGKVNAMYNLGLSYLESSAADRDPQKGVAWMRRAAEGGQPDAQRWLRGTGYAGTLPPPLNEAAMMSPAPKGASGHTKICGLLIS